MPLLNILVPVRNLFLLQEKLLFVIWGRRIGATTSLFPYDERMAAYLRATGREEVVMLAEAVAADLRPDDEVMALP